MNAEKIGILSDKKQTAFTAIENCLANKNAVCVCACHKAYHVDCPRSKKFTFIK